MIQVYKGKKGRLKCYQMVLYTIKNLLPTKDILKILPSSGINGYIKLWSVLEKEHWWNKIKQY